MPSGRIYDHDEIKRLRDTGQSLPLETIIGNYRRQYQGGRILEADLEFQEDRYVYELEILQEVVSAWQKTPLVG